MKLQISKEGCQQRQEKYKVLFVKPNPTTDFTEIEKKSPEIYLESQKTPDS